MSASAGRVLLIPRGTYDANVTYTPLDVVKYGVSSYVCKAETTGNVPTNTTYWQVLATGIDNVTPESIGIGYGISSDSGAARTATLADYVLTPNGLVSVSFASDVPANATLNINSQGAKAIYYRGSALVASVIRGGDTVTFAYDGTRYQVLCIDGGAGHKIVNSAGTELTQRDALQFTNGLEATDNAQGQKTEVGMTYDTISLADWNAMTTQEQEAYKASHYRFGIELPDTEGVINAEYMTLLWENPNTSASFAGQTVTLSSADYDFYICYFTRTTSTGTINKSTISPKGKGIILDVADSGYTYVRNASYVSDTSISFGQGYKDSTADNSVIIPISIYGIKSSFQFKVNAIATDLSTRADHCFLDDDTTTVEEALKVKYSTSEREIGEWIDGSILYEKTISCGAMPNNDTKNVPHNISNISLIVDVRGTTSMSNGTTAPLPYSHIADVKNQMGLAADKTNIVLSAGSNRTAYTTTYVTLRYTKSA